MKIIHERCAQDTEDGATATLTLICPFSRYPAFPNNTCRTKSQPLRGGVIFRGDPALAPG